VSVKPTVAFSIAGAISSYQGLRTIRDSGGNAYAASDEEILEAQRLLAVREGIFAESSSAASVAVAKKMAEEKHLDRNELAVYVVTSSGLKNTGAPKKTFREFCRP